MQRCWEPQHLGERLQEHTRAQCTGKSSNTELISRLKAITGELSCAAMKRRHAKRYRKYLITAKSRSSGFHHFPYAGESSARRQRGKGRASGGSTCAASGRRAAGSRAGRAKQARRRRRAAMGHRPAPEQSGAEPARPPTASPRQPGGTLLLWESRQFRHR